MVITLYKNCVLNDKYKDIFCNRTILESYLSTLSSTTITIADTFSRNKDSLYIEDVTNSLSVQDYNYLKVSDNMITFYAFITSIDWLAEAYIINYKEDIIANHFDKIKVRNGLQTRTRIKKKFNNGTQSNITLFKEPLQSEGNNYPVLVKAFQNNTATAKYYGDNTVYTIPTGDKTELGIFVKVQLYKLVSGTTDKYRRKCLLLKMGQNISSEPTTYSYNFNHTFSNRNFIDVAIEDIITGQASQTIGSINDGWNYDIDAIYIVPVYLFSNTSTVSDSENIYYYSDNSIRFYSFDDVNDKISQIEFSIPYDRKLFGIGFINKPFNIITNGTATNTKIVCEVYGYNFSIFMYVQNNIYEVTDLFEYDIPFSSISASELQLRRMQINIKNNDLKTDIENANIEKRVTTIKEVTGAIKSGSSMMASGIGAALGGGMYAIEHQASAMGSAADFIGNIMSAEGQKEIIENNISNANYKIEQINGALYSNASIKANKVSYKTAREGLILYSVNEENTSQITAMQALTGYIVNELVNNNINDTYKNYLITNNTYDVLQFSEINIYGTISQNYLRAIEMILLSGVRIWGSTSINV